jgi:hypothetical protein
MKPKKIPESEEHLHAVLREWVVETPLPPRFQEQVWQRIARAEAEPGGSLWVALARLVEVVLPRPKIAVSFVASLLLAGVAAGSVAAQFTSHHVSTTLSERYVQSVDPYHTIAPQP